MADLLIRDVPDHVVAAIDATARRLGLSRSEYLRRQVAAAPVAGGPVTAEDLARFSATFVDLADPEVMARAWECLAHRQVGTRPPRSEPRRR